MPSLRKLASGAVHRVVVTALAVAGLAAAGPAHSSAAEEKVSFTFAPPDGTTYLQTVETVRELAAPGGTRHVDRSVAEARVTIRKEADGFVVTTSPVAMKMTRDGKPVADPALEILDDTVVTFHVSPAGRLERVTGYEDSARRVRETFPPEVAAAALRLLGPDTLVARARAEWDGRIGDFAGRTFPVGEPWDGAATFTFPSGQKLDYFVRTSVTGKAPCPTKRCVEVRFRYDSDPTALGELSARVPDADAQGSTEVRAKLASLSGAGTRVIDPETMIVYSERIVRTMKIRTETPQGAVPVATREEQRYSITPQ